MKKLYAPLLAVGLLLGVYACSKQSSSGSPDPQPVTASQADPQVKAPSSDTNLQLPTGSSVTGGDTDVSPEEFPGALNNSLEAAAAGLDVVVKRTKEGNFTIHLVQPTNSAAARVQICTGKSGFTLGYCVIDYLNHNPNADILITHCGAGAMTYWCAYDTSIDP